MSMCSCTLHSTLNEFCHPYSVCVCICGFFFAIGIQFTLRGAFFILFIAIKCFLFDHYLSHDAICLELSIIIKPFSTWNYHTLSIYSAMHHFHVSCSVDIWNMSFVFFDDLVHHLYFLLRCFHLIPLKFFFETCNWNNINNNRQSCLNSAEFTLKIAFKYHKFFSQSVSETLLLQYEIWTYHRHKCNYTVAGKSCFETTKKRANRGDHLLCGHGWNPFFSPSVFASFSSFMLFS